MQYILGRTEYIDIENVIRDVLLSKWWIVQSWAHTNIQVLFSQYLIFLYIYQTPVSIKSIFHIRVIRKKAIKFAFSYMHIRTGTNIKIYTIIVESIYEGQEIMEQMSTQLRDSRLGYTINDTINYLMILFQTFTVE